MSIAIYEQLLANKRRQQNHHYDEYLRLKQEADDLEEKLDRGETPIWSDSTELDDRYLSRDEKSELRMAKVLALFQRKNGRIYVEDVMRECKISKTPAKEWMNSRIDMDPDACPWERWDGFKTIFVLKPAFMQSEAKNQEAVVEL